MHNIFVGLLALVGYANLASGQILHCAGERPSFEVASIKSWKRSPSPPDGTAAPVKVMKVAPVGAGPGEIGADEPAFFSAIREQLGLMLVPSKAPVEVIVIDHIEQPSAN